MNDQELDAILERIRSGTSTTEDQERLYQAFLPMIRSRAGRYRNALPTPDEVQDLIQEGFLALMDAAASWEPDTGSFKRLLRWHLASRFNEYVSRANGTGSRGTSERRRKMARFEADFVAKYGVKPSAQTVGRALGMSAELVEKWRSIRPKRSLDDEVADGLTIAETVRDPLVDVEAEAVDEVVNEHVAELLRRYVDELPSLQRKAVYLIYFKGLPRRAAARILHVSYDKMERLHDAALRSIRKREHLVELGRWLPERIGSRPYQTTGRSSGYQSSTERSAIWLLERDERRNLLQRRMDEQHALWRKERDELQRFIQERINKNEYEGEEHED